MLASFLEHGNPLKISPALLELGFPARSLHLSRLRDPDAAAELRSLAKEYFQTDTGISLVSLTGEEAAPPTILEKKSLEDAGRQRKLKELAESHPLITAALDIFEGELGEVTELDDPKQV
jgi:DNA polymerase-3 subunit gamma/tau